MNIWDTLGLTATTDRKSIKRAYVRLIKQYHPEDHPEKFQEVRDAYEAALRWAEKRSAPDEGRRTGDGTGDQPFPPGDAPLGSFSGDSLLPPQALDTFDQRPLISDTLNGEPDGRPQSMAEELPADRRFSSNELPPLIIDGGGEQINSSAYTDLEGPAGGDSIPDYLDQIRGYLADNRQQAACDFLEQTLGDSIQLSHRLSLSRGLYEMLTDLPEIPMGFIEFAIERLDWDIRSVQAMGGSGDGASELFETYMALQRLKQTLDEERRSIQKNLRKKQPRPYIAFQAIKESRRNDIREWIEALAPYRWYYDYLSVDPMAVAAWWDELQQPQYPPEDAMDDVYSMLLAMGYAYYAARALPLPIWGQWCAGVTLAVILGIVLLVLPAARWAGFKWREDWRPRASGKFNKNLTDLVPLGIMAFYATISIFAFESRNNAGTYALYTYMLFLFGLRNFLILAFMTAMFNDIYVLEVGDLNAAVTWFVIPALWLKIKLTLVDNWQVKEKTAGWHGFVCVAVLCIAIIVFKWPLPF